MSNKASDFENKGIIYMDNNELDKALDYFNKAHEEYKKTNNLMGISAEIKFIGIVKMKQGELNEAKKLFFESLELSQLLKYKENIADCYANLGMLHILLKDAETSLRYLIKGYQLSHEISYSIGLNYTGNLIKKASNIQNLNELLNVDADKIIFE